MTVFRKANLYGFEAEYKLWTWSNPIPPRERVLGTMAFIDIAVKRYNGREAWFSIRAIGGFREGKGRTAMKWLLALADKYSVVLRGEIAPGVDSPMGEAALAAWYQRLGFKVDGRDIIREPEEWSGL